MKTGRKRDHSPAAPVFRDLQGAWRSQGYGKILLIESDQYTLFEETTISCRKLYTGAIAELNHYYEDLVVSATERAFSAHRVSGVARIGFRRLKALPANATATRNHASKDPEYNFKIFWRTFDEQYALFELKSVAWDQAYHTYHPQINACSSRETLFATMAAMLRPLKDGHIRLNTPWGHYNAGAHPALYQRLTQELEDANDDRELASYLGDLKEWLHDVIHEDYLGNGVSHGGNRLLVWGHLNDAADYLNIRAMAGQSGKTGRPAADLSVVDSVMQKVLADIGEPTQGILSDTLERHLPNGWHLTLSNEIYRAYDGQLYEDVSIPPHIRLQYLGRKGREEGKDPMLERVLRLVGG